MGHDYNDERSQSIIKEHEGCRHKIYLDSKGIPTVGYGHALLEGSYMPPHVINTLFEMDYEIAVADYKSLKFDLDPVRRAVVINMLFNLGRTRFLGFKNTIRYIRSGQYVRAGDEMLDSKWAREDVSEERSGQLSRMMKTGNWSGEWES